MIRFEPQNQMPAATVRGKPQKNKTSKTDTAGAGVSLELNSANAARLLLIGLVAAAGYLTWRAWSAEMTFRRALAAAPQNGAETFNLMQKVIKLNPKNPNYRLNHSQVDLALANVLSRPQTDKDGNQATPSAQTVNTVRQLVGLSVNQAKSAVSLAPQNAAAWANLASIYRALIGVAAGAEDWALAAYQQAVALSPNDPLLRLDLGGIYFIRKDYQNAITQFSLATQLKNDLPNSWYNLAQAYKADGDEQKALDALRQTLAVLPADLKNDRQAVQKEIAALEGSLPEEGEKTKTEQLKEPSEASPSAKNVPPPVEVESPPATESAQPNEPIRITP